MPYRPQPQPSPLLNKSLLFVGGGDQADCTHYARLAHLGARIFISDTPNGPWPERVEKANLAGFIPFDFSDSSDLGSRFSAAMASTHGVPSRFDSVLSIDEVHLLVAARLAKHLGHSFQSVSAVGAAQDKVLTRLMLDKAGLPSVAYRSVSTEAEARAAAKEMGGRLILKPVDGQHSHGVHLIESPDAAAEALRQELPEDTESESGSMKNRRRVFIVEEYLSGEEVDVDFLMQDGHVVYSNVVDNWPISPPWFEESAGELPSTLPAPLQKMARDYAADCVRALGFQNGLFHTELKCTPNGPRLLEINPRLGCGPCSDLHRAACGINLVEELCVIAAGIPCKFEQKSCSPISDKHVVGVCLLAPFTGVVTNEWWLDQAVESLVRVGGDVVAAFRMVDRGQRVTGKCEGSPDCLGVVVVEAEDRFKCVNVVKKLQNLLKVPIDSVQGSYTGSGFEINMPKDFEITPKGVK